MSILKRNKALFLLALSLLALNACSDNADQAELEAAPQATEAAVPEAEPEPKPEPKPEPAAKLPEVVVLHGREELVPWLESENWWGPENH